MSAAAKAIVELFALIAVQGTVLAVLGFAIVRAGRLRPGWQAAVWLIVLAKFVLPWGPALPWSLADVFVALRMHGGSAAMVVAPQAAVADAPPPSVAWLAIAAVWRVRRGGAGGDRPWPGRPRRAPRASRAGARTGGARRRDAPAAAPGDR